MSTTAIVHSKVMAWVGVDRMVRVVEQHKLDGPVDRWRRLRREIAQEICEKRYDADPGTFTQYFGGTELDSSLLLLSRVGFLSWRDERMAGTVRAIERELCETASCAATGRRAASTGFADRKRVSGLQLLAG